MPNKRQIDSLTKTPKGDESDLERFNRLRKRIAWDLDISEEDKKFLDSKKDLKEPKINSRAESTHSEKAWNDACNEFSYLANGGTEFGEDPCDGAPEIKTGERGGRYTEDVTKDGRPYRRYF